MLISVILVVLLTSPTLSYTKPITCTKRIIRTASLSPVFAEDRNRGIYARPSSQISRGSGFFIPGLRGPRVRVVASFTLVLAVLLNGLHDGFKFPVSEVSGVLAGVGLGLSAVVEVLKEKSVQQQLEQLEIPDGGSIQFVKLVDSAEQHDSLIASAILTSSPSTSVFLLDNAEARIALHYAATATSAATNATTKTLREIISSAPPSPSSSSEIFTLDAATHVVGELLPPNTKTVLLTASKQSTWIVASSERIERFEKRDLKMIRFFTSNPKGNTSAVVENLRGGGAISRRASFLPFLALPLLPMKSSALFHPPPSLSLVERLDPTLRSPPPYRLDMTDVIYPNYFLGSWTATR